MLGHQFVYVVVVPVLHTGAQPARPRRPHTIPYPTLSKGSHAGVIAIECVGEVEVLYLYRVLTGCNVSKDVPILADERSSEPLVRRAERPRISSNLSDTPSTGSASGGLPGRPKVLQGWCPVPSRPPGGSGRAVGV